MSVSSRSTGSRRGRGRSYGRLCAAALALAAPAGCSNLVSLPEREPTIEGEIVAVEIFTPVATADGSRVRTIRSVHIRAVGDPCGIVFFFSPKTPIGITRSVGPTREASFDDVAVGQVARAWARGEVFRSCPGGAEAAALEILRDVDILR